MNTRLIKKYKNRRLYDTDKSQYITIDDLKNYVNEGITFKVEDAATAQDLTNATLLQILVEIETGSTAFLSSESLRQLITLAQHPMQQTFKTMLEEFFVAVNKPIQANPLLPDYKKLQDVWQKNMDDMMAHWKKFI